MFWATWHRPITITNNPSPSLWSHCGHHTTPHHSAEKNSPLGGASLPLSPSTKQKKIHTFIPLQVHHSWLTLKLYLITELIKLILIYFFFKSGCKPRYRWPGRILFVDVMIMIGRCIVLRTSFYRGILTSHDVRTKLKYYLIIVLFN